MRPGVVRLNYNRDEVVSKNPGDSQDNKEID